MVKIISIFCILVSFSAWADLDGANEIIFESQIKASDLNIKFQELNTLLAAKSLTILSFASFSKGDDIIKEDILAELNKVNSVPNIQQRIYALNDTIDSADINEEFDFAEDAINAITVEITINKNLNLADSSPTAPFVSSNFASLEVLSNATIDMASVPNNTSITLTATAQDNYEFVNWTGDVCNNLASVTCDF